VLLLEFNQDAQTLLDWVIDCCYTAPRDIADNCFLALGTVFNNRSVYYLTPVIYFTNFHVAHGGRAILYCAMHFPLLSSLAIAGRPSRNGYISLFLP